MKNLIKNSINIIIICSIGVIAYFISRDDDAIVIKEQEYSSLHEEELHEITRQVMEENKTEYEALQSEKQLILQEITKANKVRDIHLNLKKKIRLRECGLNDYFCKDDEDNYKAYKDGQNWAIGIASNNFCKKNDCEKLGSIPEYKMQLILHDDIEDKIKLAKANIWYWTKLTEDERDEIIDFNYQQKKPFHFSGMHKHLSDFYNGKDSQGRIKAKQVWAKYVYHKNAQGKVVASKGLKNRSNAQISNFFSEEAKRNAHTQIARQRKPKTLDDALKTLNI